MEPTSWKCRRRSRRFAWTSHWLAMLLASYAGPASQSTLRSGFRRAFLLTGASSRRFLSASRRACLLFTAARPRSARSAQPAVVLVLSRLNTVTNPAVWALMAMPGLHPVGAVNGDNQRDDSAYFL